MMGRIHFSWLILLLFSAWSCEEIYFPETDDVGSGQLVISGYIDQSEGPYYFNVAETRTSSKVPIGLEGACLTAHDEFGNSEEMVDQQEGSYLLEGRVIRGMPGRSYQLRIDMKDGRTYLSTWERMPMLLAKDELHWIQDKELSTSDYGVDFSTNVVRVMLNSDLPGTNDSVYLHWKTEETFQFIPTDFPDPFGSIPPPCYVTQSVGSDRVHILATSTFKGTKLEIPSLIVRALDDSFLSKHIFSIYQLSVSRAHYQYLQDLKSLTERTGTLFDSPPGQALGNIRLESDPGEFALGYFGVVFTDTTRIAVYPNHLVDVLIIDDCKFDGSRPFFNQYSSQCLNCSTVPRSTYTRPYFWLATN